MFSTGLEYKTLSYALIGLAGLLIWAISYWRIFKKAQLYIRKGKTSWFISVLRFSLFFLGIAAWLLISYSMTGPRRASGQIKNQIEVNDIFIVLDTSLSMSAVDLRPNRLEAAKERILQFVKMHVNDRIGLIIFSEKAFTLLPLTTDMKLIEQTVPRVIMGPLGGGTNIGDALALAVGRESQSAAKSKVIILLTDGVNNVGSIPPLQAAEQARDLKVKIYTIGIGSDENAVMPMGRGFVKIPGGSVDLKTLEQISQTTGGKSYKADDNQGLQKVLEDINRLEKTKVDTSGRVVYEELYLKYLFWGVMLLMGVELTRRFIIREGL